MEKNVLVLIPLKEEQKRILEEKAPSANFTYAKSQTVDAGQVQNANIIIGNPPVHMLKASKKLKWLQLNSAGVGEYAEEGVLPEGAVLTNATGAYGPAISEYMLGVLLELFKKLHIYRDNQAEANWSYEGKVKAIFDSTALIVGAGDIGGEFAKRLKGLGAYTIGVKRTEGHKPDYLDELYLMDKLEALLPRADIVALSLPETPLTKGIINESTLKLMKKDAVLINVGRGSAVDTEALCDALEKGQLLGAALDVTEPEPLPKEHRLWKIKNAVITPHVSGGYSLEETRRRIAGIAAGNLEAFIRGTKLINVVDCSKGY
ncbi:putative 2-hydroxyacid dehydrogenase [Ruminiclostridium hungatei]|uniref:Putative 2-hydroxyacid dehydrogenase n=1 Tax=Ruminiclostridium hungatei TaxID=48256 RepID=A0A1V4SM73_RUMHU|nr:D-2-hydroxyacid dehydrogenase [Ruminiclostridium hungatei]OPX44960.1 putative 2-hydroxyacid dehydrogenase [Ruminiclostridium hungatei]